VAEVKKLLEEGCNPNTRDSDGWTPLHWAAKEGYVNVARLLLERGADLNARDNNGATPLHVAALYGRANVVKLLLEEGANPNVRDNFGATPLYWAAYGGYVDVVELLLEKGANPNVRDNDGWTPLHVAASRGHIEVVEFLLEGGADPNIRNNYGKTPLDLAREKGRSDVVRLLKKWAGRSVKPPRRVGGSAEPARGIGEFSGGRDLLALALQISREPVSYRPVEVPGPSFNSSLGFSDCASAGLGGFFAVYRCRRGEQYVAVKVPHQLSRYFETGRLAGLTRQPEALQREVEVVKKLDHPNVLRLLEAYLEYGILVYEWGDGGTLADQSLSVKDRLKALVHVAEGLRYLHELGLYHGDLKPTNVVIVGGVCKLADLASLRSALSTSLGSRYAGCTKGFCAPEQVFSDLAAEAKSLGLQNRRDVYQLGNLALWLFGVETVDGEQWDQTTVDNAAEKLEKKVRGLGAVVRRALARRPLERPHIVKVLEELVEIYEAT
jgi:hypothetical protein